MEKWFVIGGIWFALTVSLTLFVRGASPARNRAREMARSRGMRRKSPAQAEARQVGATGER